MNKLHLRGFKCFRERVLELNRLTILTGNNGVGKSSVIQALLLLREVLESCASYSEDNCDWSWTQKDVPLNCAMKLQLGSYDDICNVDSSEIFIGIDDVEMMIEQGSSNEQVKALLTPEELVRIPTFLTRSKFYYLNAERIGPRRFYDISMPSFMHSGIQGEYAGNILLEASKAFPKVDKERLFGDDGFNNFNIQVDRWMSYIFSDVSVKSVPITPNVCQIKLRGSRTLSVAPNTGFGYTYALPIVIDGLIAEKGSLLVIENPEAHLHPRAQSNIGFFIGQMVAAGLKVVVETHSEHVVNGIRRAALSDIGLSPQDVCIYFFTGDRDGCNFTRISMDDNGNLSDFPVDFFDQVRQDMLEIIRLATIRRKK